MASRKYSLSKGGLSLMISPDIVSEVKCFGFENGLSHDSINWQTKVSMVFGEIQNVNCQIIDPMTSLAATKEILSS